MKRFLTLILAILMTGVSCAQKKADDGWPPYIFCKDRLAITEDDPTRDDILIIGDSISFGYSPFVQQNLPNYEVIQSFCNAEGAAQGQINDTSYAKIRPHWKVITFNHGLWDIPISFRISTDTYKAQLRSIAIGLTPYADQLIFFTTTMIPAGTDNRTDPDAERFNQAAREVMDELGIPVYDLHAFSHTIEHLQLPADVHYTDEGSEELAGFVTDAILDFL